MDKHIYIKPTEFDPKHFERYMLSADVGGEHTYLAAMGIKDKKNFEILFIQVFETSKIEDIFNCLNQVLAEAHNDYKIEIARAVIAAAGPVSRKRTYIKLTNVDLKIDSKEILENTLLKKVILLNDFEAIGYGLDLLDLERDVILLPHVGEDLTRKDNLTNTYAVMGAGNGLGVSIAYYSNNNHMHVPLPSEGGHIEFSPHDHLELELVHYLKDYVLKKKVAHPEYERLVSGPGINHIYDFLRHKKMLPETEANLQIDALKGNEKLVEIQNHVNDETCKKAIELFIMFYARAARNLALTSECYSGLFLAGGIVIKYMEKFIHSDFMKEFEMHDVRSDVLRKTPVYIIKNKNVGLLGCCNVAVNFFNLM